MKVYVVTTGQYSDFGIRAVFSIEASAQEYIEVQGNLLETPGIEEYDLDMPKEEWKCTRVRMAQDGRVIETEPIIDVQGFIYFDSSGNLVWTVRSDDQDWAIKVVNEKRAQIIARNIWGNNEAVNELFQGGTTKSNEPEMTPEEHSAVKDTSRGGNGLNEI